jgi:hypothetical protein
MVVERLAFDVKLNGWRWSDRTVLVQWAQVITLDKTMQLAQ